MSHKQNRIELKDGIICYTQAGKQTKETINMSIAAIRLLAEGLPEVRILVDYRYSGNIDIGAKNAGFHAIKQVRFNKVAIFGASEAMSKLVGGMAKITGKTQKVHFAKTRQDAIAWLRSD